MVEADSQWLAVTIPHNSKRGEQNDKGKKTGTAQENRRKGQVQPLKTSKQGEKMLTFIGFLLCIALIAAFATLVEICGDHIEDFIKGKLK